MKKLTFIIAFVAFICLTGILDAQIKYGIQAGINISNVAMKNTNTESISGLNAGLMIDFKFNDNFILSSGLKFSQKGFYNGYHVYEHPTYLDLPIQAKYSLNLLQNWCAIAYLGGYVGYGISYKAVDDLNNRTFNYSWNESNYERIDLGPMLGVGVSFKNLQLTVDYQIGLINMNETLGELNNRTVSIALTYFF